MALLFLCVPALAACSGGDTDDTQAAALSTPEPTRASTTVSTTAAPTTTTRPRLDADRAAAEHATLRATDFSVTAQTIPGPPEPDPPCEQESLPVADRCVVVGSPFFVTPAGQGAGNSSIMFVPDASVANVLLDEYLGPAGLAKVRTELQSAQAVMGGPDAPENLVRREDAPQIGDESVAFRLAATVDSVIFRKGRAFVRVTAIIPNNGQDLAVELAGKIAARLP